MAITWRNVNAPNLQGVQQGVAAAGQSFTNAFNTLGGIGEQQREMNIYNQQLQTDKNTQSAIEAIRTNAPTIEAYDKMKFGDVVNPFGEDLDRAKVYKYYEDFDNQLRQEEQEELNLEKGEVDILKGKQALGTGRLQQQKLKGDIARGQRQDQEDTAMNNIANTIMSAYAQGKTPEDIKTQIMPTLLTGSNAKFAGKAYQFFDGIDKSRQSLTVNEQRHVTHLDSAAKLEHDDTIGSITAEMSALNSTYPVDQSITPQNEVKTYGDTFTYLQKVAPAQGWWHPSVDTDWGAEGKELQKKVESHLADAEKLINDKLPKGTNYKIPPMVLQKAVETMPVGTDKEMDTTMLVDRLVDLSMRENQNRVNKEQKRIRSGQLRELKKEADWTLMDTLKNNPSNVKNLLKG